MNPLYLIFNKVNGYFKEIDGYKYLTLVLANKRKEIIRRYEELWRQIRDLIRTIINQMILMKNIWKSNLI